MALSNTHIGSSSTENLFLFTACEQGDLQTIETRLASFSSSQIYSIRDEHQATLIHYASRFGHLNILKYFLEVKQIDFSQLRTENGATCIHDAAVCNQIKILQYVFNYYKSNLTENLRWDVRDKEGNTTLHLAAYYNAFDVVYYLLEIEHADPRCRSYAGYQPIHCAAEHGHTHCVKILIKKSPDLVNQQTNQLETPLHLASQIGSLETIQLLIAHGANVQLKNRNGSTCLHIACQNNHLNIVQWLIEKHDAKVNDIDYMHNTPLHYAAETGSENIINYLLNQKAKAISNKDGNTPLHVAAKYGHRNVCVILIERACCSLSLTNNEHLNAADLANISGYLSLASELRLQMNPSASIQVEKATVVRLVIKKKNVPHSDAWNQVNEQDFSNANDHISDKYAPWLKMTNQTVEEFQNEIQDVQSNLRKIQKHPNHQELLLSKEDISTTTDPYSHLNDLDGHEETIYDSLAMMMSNVKLDDSELQYSWIEKSSNTINET